MTTLLNLITLEQLEVKKFSSNIQNKIIQPKSFENKSKKMKHY